MSPTVVVALVLLPALMFLLALGLAAALLWLGVTALPRARRVVRAARRRRTGPPDGTGPTDDGSRPTSARPGTDRP